MSLHVPQGNYHYENAHNLVYQDAKRLYLVFGSLL